MSNHILRGTSRLIVLGVVTACVSASTWAQNTSPFKVRDRRGDAVIRRTDLHNDGVLGDNVVLPDLIAIQLGGWVADAPWNDPFMGTYTLSPIPHLFRLDVQLAGLVNPAGPLGDNAEPYDPFAHGPSPLLGFIEIDMDRTLSTGGEVRDPSARYLGVVGRFGGRPFGDLGANAASDHFAFDGTMESGPPVERSGEEFHLSLAGPTMTVANRHGDQDVTFDAGDLWDLEGAVFIRSHGYEEFSNVFGGRGLGAYEPTVRVRFAHSHVRDITTVSIVWAITADGAASLISPVEPPQSYDFDAGNHMSVAEGLRDLQLSAENADARTRNDSEFPIIEQWDTNEFPGRQNFTAFLDPSHWRVNAVLGTGYPDLPDRDLAVLVWTDAFPNPLVGDVNGDGHYTLADRTAVENYIVLNDGNSKDADDTVNGEVLIDGFASGFALFDINYDGRVNSVDAALTQPRLGDLNRDGNVDADDFEILGQILGSDRSDGRFDPLADLDNNDRINAVDFGLFAALLDN